MASNKQIDNAFRIAGYDFGRPTADSIPEPIYPYDYSRIVALFSDDVVEQLLSDLGENPNNRAETTNKGFPYQMAAAILRIIAASDLTSDGRNVTLTSFTQGGLTSTFEISRNYKENLEGRIRILQAQGRRLADESQQSVVTVAPVLTDFYRALKNTLGEGTNIDLNFDDAAQTISIASPYNIRAANGFGDAVYDALKLVLKTDNNVIVTFNDQREEIRFEAEIDRQTLHEPIKAMLIGGENISITANDVDDTITIASTGGAGSLSDSPLHERNIAIEQGLVSFSQALANQAQIRSGLPTENTFDRGNYRSGYAYIDGQQQVLVRMAKGDNPFRYRIHETDGGQTYSLGNLKKFDTSGQYDYYAIDLRGIFPNTGTLRIERASDGSITRTKWVGGIEIDQADLYSQTQNIIQPGAGILIENDDDANTQSIGLNGALLQTQVITSAKQERTPERADRGKLVAVSNNDETKLRLITAPTASSYTPPNELSLDLAFSDGTTAEIDYFRTDHIRRLFGNLAQSRNVKRKDIRIGFHGFINGFTSRTQLRSLIVAGITVRTNSALQPGEYIRNGFFNLYGEVTNSNIETILTNQTSGTTRVSLSYNIGGLFSLNKDIAWLTAAQATASPLAPYIPSEAIIGGVGGGGGGLKLASTERNLGGLGSNNGTDWVNIIQDEFYGLNKTYLLRLVHRTSSEVCHDSAMIRGDNFFPQSVKQTIMACGKKFQVRANSNRIQVRVETALPSGEFIFIWPYDTGLTI